MDLTVERAEVWAATIEDKPGGLATKLNTLTEAQADLEFIISRRAPDKPGTGVVFVTPLRGDREIEAATQAGFTVSKSLQSIRIEGRNEPGVAAAITRKLSQAGLNLRGLSGAVIGARFVIYIAFDSSADADRAMKILQKA